MSNPLNSPVCSYITPYFDLIRLAFYFKKISLSALSGSSHARCSVMTILLQCSRDALKAQKGLSTIRLRYPVPGTILARTGAGTGFKKMAGYPAKRNRISGTALLIMHRIIGRMD